MNLFQSTFKSPTFKPLLKIALPVMLANGLETLYNMTDTWFLGHLGAKEVAVPSVSMNFIFLLIQMGMGFSMAGTTLIARGVGQGKQEKVDFYLGQMTAIMLILSIFIAILGFTFSKDLLLIIGTPQDILLLAHSYLQVICLGIPFMYTFFILQGAMQGTGNTLLSLKIQLISTGINIPLDYILIFGFLGIPALGVKGAAIATITSRAIASITGFIILIRGKQGITLRAKNLKLSFKSFSLFLKLGLPASLSQSASSIGFILIQSLVNSFGTVIVAAFGLVNRIHSVFYMPAQGIAKGVTTLVGQSLGEKRIDKAKEAIGIGIRLSLFFMIPAMALTFFYGSYFIHFFVDDPAVIAAGHTMFQIISPSVIIFSMFMVYAGAFQGAGDVKALMMMHIGRLWGIRLPLAWLFTACFAFGPKGLWLAMFISNVGITLFGYIHLRSGHWISALKGDF